jgi:hypothetical protein
MLEKTMTKSLGSSTQSPDPGMDLTKLAVVDWLWAAPRSPGAPLNHQKNTGKTVKYTDMGYHELGCLQGRPSLILFSLVFL